MRRVKLHTKFIVLLTSVSLVPLIIVSAVTLARFQEALRDDASKLGHQLAATASAEVETFMVSQLRILDNIAAIYQPEFPIQSGIADQLLENILFRSENFSDITVVDIDGVEIARKNRRLVLTEADRQNVADSPRFRAVKEGGIYVGPVVVENGRPFFTFGMQILNARSEFAGAVFAEVDARIMPRVVGAISEIVGPPGRVYIVNERGVVIAHPDQSYVLAERNLSELPSVRSIVAAPQDEAMPHSDFALTSSLYVNELGQSVLGSAHTLTIELPDSRSASSSSINWYVIAEQPEDRVYAEAESAAWFSLILSLAAIIFAAAAAFFFAGRVSRPIEALHRAALEFGKGNLAYRTDVQTGDEIGDLARSFNTTAETLAKTVSSLENEERVTAAERNKLRVILSGITNAVIAVDLDRNIILFNKAAETLTGVGADKVFGKPVTDIVKLYDGDSELRPDTYCPSEGEELEGVIYSVNNLKITDRRGSEHIVNLVASRIREGASIQLGCVLTFQDITREAVMERTKREFVSIAAHQLRTPLTGMSWTVEALLSETKGVLNAAQKELVQRGLGAIRHMVDLVNDLLNVTRIEEGKFGIKPTRQLVYEFLANVVEGFKKSAEVRKIELVVNIAPNIQPFDFDADKMEFVIGNILDNAIKYTPVGGKVTLEVREQDGAVQFTIRDTGIGISKGESDRIFTKFFRSAQATSYFTDGSGLGLYVAKNIVNQHNGSIRFESEEKKGTTFVVSLPLNQKERI